MYFYLVVAVSMLFGRAKWFITSAFMLLTVLTPIAIFGLPDNYGFYGFYFSHQYISMMTNPIVIEFLIGILVYFIFNKMNDKNSFLWTVFIILSIIAFAMNLYSPFVYLSRVTAWAIPAAIMMIAFLKLESMGKVKFNKFIMQIGNIS